MDRLDEYDELEEQFRDVRDWNDLAAMDDDKIRDLLGEEEGEQLDQLRQVAKHAGGRRLHPARPPRLRADAQGVRKIGEKALTESSPI